MTTALPEVVVTRPRLIRRLVEARAPLAVVSAPAGYGKTTLLEQWDRCDARPFAWVSGGDDEADGAAFVAAIDDALAELEPRGRFVLVLDDLHLLRSGA